MWFSIRRLKRIHTQTRALASDFAKFYNDYVIENRITWAIQSLQMYKLGCSFLFDLHSTWVCFPGAKRMEEWFRAISFLFLLLFLDLFIRFDIKFILWVNGQRHVTFQMNSAHVVRLFWSLAVAPPIYAAVCVRPCICVFVCVTCAAHAFRIHAWSANGVYTWP